MGQRLNELVSVLRAVAEPTRLRLLAICAQGELTVTEMTAILAQSQPRVSRHLKVMCDAGLLIRFRERHNIYYRVPAKVDGVDLVQQVLAARPRDDETLELDRQRLEQVKAERAKRAADYLRFNAEDWAKLREVNVGEAQINRTLSEMVDIERVGDLLDVGTGTGRMLRLLGSRADSALGIDISADMLAVARSNLHAAGLGKVMVRLADMYNLPFADASFDTITLDEVLYQAEDPAGVVREVARTLRPGGQLIVIDYAPFELEHGPADLGVSEDDLRAWLAGAALRCSEVRRLDGKSLSVLLALGRRRSHQGVAA